MKKIYVVLSATPTLMGMTIRTFTRSAYNHVSISLTVDLSEMYSFARYRAVNPFVGGFIREFPLRLSHGKNSSVRIKVYEIPVAATAYEKIRSFIYAIRDDEERNIYNSLAVLGSPFGRGRNTYKAYVCTDFVTKALLSGDVTLSNGMLTPGGIEEILEDYLCYTGELEQYIPPASSCFYSDEFFTRSTLLEEMRKTTGHFYALFKRNLKGQQV